ncbi:MAG: hypothetical protein NTX28_11065 [Novosphingobium sp.]|nr:hypothetical protein [Novosphingobium sp.]
MVAVLLYAIAAVLAWRARAAARKRAGLLTLPQWHETVWLFAAVLFALCAISRLLGIEEVLRDSMRGELQVERVYNARWEFQSVLASVVIIAVALLVVFAATRVQKSGVLKRRGLSRQVIWAAAACCAMIVLITFRMISLHALDSLLYRGPRLNWVVDVGATVALQLLAWRYAAELGKAKAQMRRTRHSENAGPDELINRRR